MQFVRSTKIAAKDVPKKDKAAKNADPNATPGATKNQQGAKESVVAGTSATGASQPTNRVFNVSFDPGMTKAQNAAATVLLENAKTIVRDQLGDTTGTGNILFVDSVNESLIQNFMKANTGSALDAATMLNLKTEGGGITRDKTTSVVVLGAVKTAVSQQNNTLHEIGHQLGFKDEKGGTGVMRGSNPDNETAVRKFTPQHVMIFELKRARAAGKR